MHGNDLNSKTIGTIWDNVWKDVEVNIYPEKVYNNLKDSWIRSHYPFVLKELSKLKKGSRVLEAGCGLGHWVFYFAKNGHFSFGIDVAKESIYRAKKMAKSEIIYSNRINFICNDLRTICHKKNVFNYIFSFGVIEHFPSSVPILQEFFRVAAPHGKILITVPNIYSIHTLTRPICQLIGKWEIGLERSYSPKRLKKLMESVGFKVIECGVMPSGLMFGLFSSYIPIIGKYLLKIFRKLSYVIEEKQSIFGFVSYAIAEKEE